MMFTLKVVLGKQKLALMPLIILGLSISCLGFSRLPCKAQQTNNAQLDRDLIRASLAPNLQEMRELFNKGANVNAKSDTGEPLFVQVMNYYNIMCKQDTKYTLESTRRFKIVINELLLRKVDVNARANGGDTALMYCNYDLQLAQTLVERGASVNVCNSKKETALHTGAEYGQSSVAKLLLEHGAQVDAVDNKGRTPLLRSGITGNIAMTKVLLAHKADPNYSAPDGTSPLTSWYGDPEVVPILIKAGAKVSLQGKRTPLRFARRNLSEYKSGTSLWWELNRTPKYLKARRIQLIKSAEKAIEALKQAGARL